MRKILYLIPILLILFSIGVSAQTCEEQCTAEAQDVYDQCLPCVGSTMAKTLCFTACALSKQQRYDECMDTCVEPASTVTATYTDSGVIQNCNNDFKGVLVYLSAGGSSGDDMCSTEGLQPCKEAYAHGYDYNGNINARSYGPIGCSTSDIYDTEGNLDPNNLINYACCTCKTNNDCISSNIYKPVCNVGTGECEPCASNADCSNPKPVCNVVSGACSSCTGDSQCDTGYNCVGGSCISETGDCILEDTCSTDPNCPTGYVCDTTSADEGFCVLKCESESYNTPTTCPTDCCKWFVVGQECKLKAISELPYCNPSGSLYPLEECDPGTPTLPPKYRDSEGNPIDDLTCIDLGYETGTLVCDQATCELDESGCSDLDICVDKTDSSICSFYNDYLQFCDLDEGSACGVSIDGLGCFIISDNGDETGECGDCASIGECLDYPTEDSCLNNTDTCNVGSGMIICEWNSDLGECYQTDDVVDRDTGETCTCPPGMGWTICQSDGYRYTEEECDCAGINKEMKVPCRITKKFPFFSAKGIIIVLALLVGYYLFINLDKKKK